MHCPERLPARSAKPTQVRGSLDDGLARLTNVTKILDRKLNDTDAAAAQIKLDASKTREAVSAVGEGLEAAKARLKTAERDIEALKLGLEGAADREVRTPSHPFPALLASWQDPVRVAQQHGAPSIARPQTSPTALVAACSGWRSSRRHARMRPLRSSSSNEWKRSSIVG